MEKDDEVKGQGNSLDFGARIYDSRLGRWLSLDPLQAKFAWISAYAAFINNPILFRDPDGKQAALSNNPFKIGKPKNPGFSYDNGFLGTYTIENDGIDYTPNRREPTLKERLSFAGWQIKALGASIPIVGKIAQRGDLSDGGKAYLHFAYGGGKNYNFDLKSYFENDNSGKLMLQNAKTIAINSAKQLLSKEGNIQMTSEGFSVNGADARFPYPETENWEKAIGAFNFWMSADITAKQDGDKLNYTMKLTIHAEDKYNFNPGMEDIETGVPDSDNGKFEVTGMGMQFMQYGQYTKTITWSVSNPQPANNSTGNSSSNKDLGIIK